MKTFKALRRPSTGEYWVLVGFGWKTSDIPDLLRDSVTIQELIGTGHVPPVQLSDMELVEVVIMEKSEYNIIKKNFLKEHPLELLFHGKREIDKVRKILKVAGGSHVLSSKEDADSSGCRFDVTCLTTSFANAYYHIGAEIGKKIISKRKSK